MPFRSLLTLLLFSSFLGLVAADEPIGVLPKAASGRSLNLDFETGTLADWTTEGKAFAQQPIQGDTVKLRRRDMASAHQGEYWIGGFERLGDQPTGTLTSAPFVVTHPWAAFLQNGGQHAETRVELVRADNGEVFFQTHGEDHEQMRRIAVDLRKLQGKKIFIRLVDRHKKG
ncbi:MAG: dehydrogenase, partial [Blastopirellula sp. JB062]